MVSKISLRSFLIAIRSRASNALSEYGLTQMGGVEEQYLVAAYNKDSAALEIACPRYNQDRSGGSRTRGSKQSGPDAH